MAFIVEKTTNFFNKLKVDIICANEEVNNLNPNGRMVFHVMISIVQNEVYKGILLTKK